MSEKVQERQVEKSVILSETPKLPKLTIRLLYEMGVISNKTFRKFIQEK